MDFFLQTRMYQAGALWPLLLSLFSYDFTLEESGVQASQETNQQHVANSLAKLSLVALGRLGGYSAGAEVDGNGTKQNGGGPEPPPENPAVRKSLAAMLTPYIARKLGTSSPAEVRTRDRWLYLFLFLSCSAQFHVCFLSYIHWCDYDLMNNNDCYKVKSLHPRTDTFHSLGILVIIHRDLNLLKTCMYKNLITSAAETCKLIY